MGHAQRAHTSLSFRELIAYNDVCVDGVVEKKVPSALNCVRCMREPVLGTRRTVAQSRRINLVRNRETQFIRI